MYAKYNQALVKRYNYRNEIDPISLNDIDECNEWLMGQMDGGYDDDDDAGNERVFEDENNDCLPWDVFFLGFGNWTANDIYYAKD